MKLEMKNPKLTLTSEEEGKLKTAKEVLKELFQNLGQSNLDDAPNIVLDVYAPDKTDCYKDELRAQIEIRDFDLIYETLAAIVGW